MAVSRTECTRLPRRAILWWPEVGTWSISSSQAEAAALVVAVVAVVY
jgi:hypothetical protein